MSKTVRNPLNMTSLKVLLQIRLGTQSCGHVPGLHDDYCDFQPFDCLFSLSGEQTSQNPCEMAVIAICFTSRLQLCKLCYLKRQSQKSLVQFEHPYVNKSVWNLNIMYYVVYLEIRSVPCKPSIF